MKETYIFKLDESLNKKVSPPEKVSTYPIILRMLVLAYQMQEQLDDGHVTNYAELGRIFGLHRSRIAQIMALLNLTPSIQEEILNSSDRTKRLTHKQIIRLCYELSWIEQLKHWEKL